MQDFDSATADVLSEFFVQEVDAVRAATSAADAPVSASCLKPCSF